MEITLAQLAIYLDGTLIGGGADNIVTGVAGLDTVTADEVTYVLNERLLEEAEASPAMAIIAPAHFEHTGKPLILVDDPRAAFGKALGYFDWRRTPLPGIDPTAVIAQSAAIHARVYIGPLAVIGEGAVIGDGSVIHAHVVVGSHVEIGKGTTLYPHVTVYPRCTIGDRVTIHAGSVIGADGFGYSPTAEGWEKIPHIGTVVIEDDVELGANLTIDRATTGETLVCRGAKIDNLVMIAHNVKVGPRAMIIAQAGIAGSAIIDEGVLIAGQAGISDHVHLYPNARVGGRSGVSRDVPAGVTVSGYPAQPHLEELKFEAALRKVPKMLETVKQLEKRIAELEQQAAETAQGE